MKEQLLDRMIRIYGLEHENTIMFARLCESDMPLNQLEFIVKCHESHPSYLNEEEE